MLDGASWELYRGQSREITYLRSDYTDECQHYRRSDSLEILTLVTSLPSLHYR